jgi:hypothetical protein
MIIGQRTSRSDGLGDGVPPELHELASGALKDERPHCSARESHQPSVSRGRGGYGHCHACRNGPAIRLRHGLTGGSCGDLISGSAQLPAIRRPTGDEHDRDGAAGKRPE